MKSTETLRVVRRFLCAAALVVLASISGGLACTREEVKSAGKAIVSCVESPAFVECASKVELDCEHFACPKAEKLTMMALCLRVCRIKPEDVGSFAGAAGVAGQGGFGG